MNSFFVIDTNTGAKYGPADIATLNQWITENRLQPTTMLQDATSGQQLMASQVPGLLFPMSQAPSAPVASAGPIQGPIQTPVQPMGRPIGSEVPYAGQQQYAYAGGDDGSKDIMWAYVSSAIGFLICPILLPIIYGIFRAVEAKKKGHRGGQTAVIVCSVLLILQIIYLVANIAAVMAMLSGGGAPR